MKLSDAELRDALCGEFAVGLLRGGARRRFALLLERDPDLQRRVQHWQRILPVERQRAALPQPQDAVWCGIRRQLGLPAPWRERFGRIDLWRTWAAAATLALAVAVGVGVSYRGALPPDDGRLAMATAQNGNFLAWVRVDSAHGTLRVDLKDALPVQAGRSYEFWYIAEGAAPVSLGVQETLGSELAVRAERRALLRRAGTIAVSLEPSGGSPSGLPTGPVLLSAKLVAG